MTSSSKKIAVLPGDGIGPEIVAEAVGVLKAIEQKFGRHFCLDYAPIGAVAIDETGNPYPEATHRLCEAADAILFGAIGHPKYDNDPSAKVRPEQGLLAMRKNLGLYANIRPVKSHAILEEASPLKKEIISGVDFVVCRELISGIYFGEPRGRSEDGEKAFDTCVYTRDEIMRMTELAFGYAENRRKKVTLLDKANVLATSRLWRATVTEYAATRPDIAFETMFIDAAAMKLIQNPRHFDVILTGNLFGDIISDEASVITGSIGTLPSASIGQNTSLYEPIHGAYPEAAGQDRANPIAAILSAGMMLEYAFGWVEEHRLVRTAVEATMNAGVFTEDIKGGKYGTRAVGKHIVDEILKH